MKNEEVVKAWGLSGVFEMFVRGQTEKRQRMINREERDGLVVSSWVLFN